jgi:hypothetical protein
MIDLPFNATFTICRHLLIQGTKRKVEESQHSDVSAVKATKKVKIAETQEQRTETATLVKPRAVTRRGLKAFEDEDDHFRVRRSKRKVV